MRTQSHSAGVLALVLALLLALGAHSFFLAPAIQQQQRTLQRPVAGGGGGGGAARATVIMMAAAAEEGRADGCDRRQALQATGAWALGTSALLSSLGARPLPAAAAAAAPEEQPAAVYIFPNVSEPAFGSVCFLEFSEAGKDGKKLGRVEVSLYADAGAPKAVENFKALCAGANGVGYKGSNVYRVISDYSIQAGDVGSKKRGASGTSSFGEPFPVEQGGLRVRHSLEGMVSMAGVGKVDSRFFFNLGQDSSWADGRYVAFGRVTKGLDVLKQLEKVDVRPPQNAPIKPVIISDAGVL